MEASSMPRSFTLLRQQPDNSRLPTHGSQQHQELPNQPHPLKTWQLEKGRG